LRPRPGAAAGERAAGGRRLRGDRLRGRPDRAGPGAPARDVRLRPIGDAIRAAGSRGARAAARSGEPSWPLHAALAASLSVVVGLIWDISWHRTIGRDTFWSPPHVLEQLAAVIAGLSCGWVVLR